MPYGRIKVDNISFTDGGADKDISISGLVKNPTFTGNVTATGTISGDIIRGGTTVSGVTVTGTTANFTSGNFSTQVSGAIVKAPAGSAGTPTVQVGTGASVSPGLYGAATDELGISTGGTSRIVVGSAGQVRIINNGTAATPSLVVNNDVDTGLYGPAANEIAIATSGTEKLRINASGAVGISGANYGTSGQVFTSNGPNSAPGWQSAATSVNLQEFTSNGTWTKPSNVTYVSVQLWAGGGGGSSGGRALVASGRTGGGGGGGGAYIEKTFKATEFTSTVAVTVGAGGTGGAAVTVDDTPTGNPGTNGGTSSFGSYLSAQGGFGGSGASFGNGGVLVSGGFGTDNNGGRGGTGGGTNGSGASGLGGFYGGAGGAGGNTVDVNNRSVSYRIDGPVSLNTSGGYGGLSTQITTLAPDVSRRIAWGASTYVLNIRSGWIATSANLSTPWTVYSSPFFEIITFLHNGTEWVVLARPISGVNYNVYTTTNFTSWTYKSTIPATATKLAYNAGTYVVVGTTTNYLATSTDLITWTTRTVIGTFRDVIHDGTRWIAAGTTTTNSGLIYTSTNGTTWTEGAGRGLQGFTKVASNGAGTIVCNASNSTNIYYSTTTGGSWTGVSVTGASVLNGITYAESKFVRVASGAIISSTDGITWTNRSTAATYWEDVIYNGTDFFATQATTDTAGSVLIGNGSTDGITWSGATSWPGYQATGEAGGNGSGYSAGGGGGGSANNGFNSGAGGNGVQGFVRIVSW